MMALKGRKTHFSFSWAPIWAREGFAKKLLFFKGDVLQLQTDTRDGERRAVRPKIGVRPKRETAAGFKSQLDIRRPLLLTFAERKISKHNVQRPTALMFRNGRLAVGAGCWQMTKVDRKSVWKKPNKLFWSERQLIMHRKMMEWMKVCWLLDEECFMLTMSTWQLTKVDRK